jgi:hypothetical protein
MASRGEELVTISIQVRARTAKAILADPGNDTTVWIPLSQVHFPKYSDYEDIDEIGIGDHISLLIPEWLAYEKGLV